MDRLAIAVATGLTVFSLPAAELIRNGGFEEGGAKNASGWSIAKGYYIEDGAGMNGNRGLVFTNSVPKRPSGFCSQTLKLKPGIAYNFSCMAKTENIEGVATDGVKACAVFLITVYDQKGKYITEYKSKKIRGTTDWTKLEGKTPRLPPNVGSVKVHPFVWHCSTGKAWFDEMSLQPIESKPIVGLYSGAYRDVAWEGEVKFCASLGIDTGTMPLDSLTAEFAISDGAYGTVRIPATGFTPFEASVSLPVAKLPLGESTVSLEIRDAKTRKLVAEEGIRFTRTEKAPKRKAWIDPKNRLIVDGKPFFPFGYYFYNVDKAMMDDYVKGPFNCMMPYPYISGKTMDLIDSYGVKVIATLKDFMPGARHAPVKKIETQGDADRGMEWRIKMMKDHPAVIAWYLNDESSVSHLPRLHRQYRIVREMDPEHPAWSVLFQYDQIRMYAGTCDVIGTDPYPIANKPIGNVSSYARATREGFFNRAIWQVPQAFDWNWCIAEKNEKDFRFPTKAETRSMMWQSVANGANGLLMYCFGTMRVNMKKAQFAAAWKEHCDIGHELAPFIPVFLSEPACVASGFPEGVSGRSWIKDGVPYLLVVNETRSAKQAKLKLDRRYPGVKGLLGDEKASVQGDTLDLSLPGIGVAMLELR